MWNTRLENASGELVWWCKDCNNHFGEWTMTLEKEVAHLNCPKCGKRFASSRVTINECKQMMQTFPLFWHMKRKRTLLDYWTTRSLVDGFIKKHKMNPVM